MEKQFLYCSLLSFFMSLSFAAIISRFGAYVGLVDTPNERSSHIVPTPRSGGIGIWLGFLFVVILFTKYQIFAILAGIVGLTGILEDYFSIPQKIRLVLQLSVSAIVAGLFVGIPTSILTALLLIFFTIVITGTANFYNFMDGIDGIAGFTGFVGFSFMAVFSFHIVGNHEIALISTALAGGCIGFLPFNFPKARVFMGDVGSVFLGFVFASFTVKLSTDISVLLCIIMFMCMFYADALVTIFYRWRRGENLIMAHRSHLYQYMCNELGIPHWKVSIAYTLAQFVFALLALLAYKQGIIWQIVLFVSFVVMFLFIHKFIKRKNPGLMLG